MMSTFVALLRGINVGGKNKVPMAVLRPLCESLGWSGVQTYIQSGNVIFTAKGGPAELEAQLEEAAHGQLGLSIPVIVRRAEDWPAYRGGNPFPKAAEDEPNRLLLCLSKAPPAPGAADALQERARDGEQVRLAGDGIWIHFPGGSGTSRLAPALIDRLVGSPVTSRNWRTVVKLEELLAG